MKTFTSLVLAYALVRDTHAWIKFGGLESSETYRPRAGEIVSHLETRGLLSWEDHELGNGVKVAVYNLQDWRDAKQYLSDADSHYNLRGGFDYTNDTLNTIEARAPMPSGSLFASLPGSSAGAAAPSSLLPVDASSSAPIASGAFSSAPIPSGALPSASVPQISSIPGAVSQSAVSSVPGFVSESLSVSGPVSQPPASSIPIGSGSAVPGTIGPDPPSSVSAAAASTTGASGTSSALMADNTNHVTKWICNQPYNIPAQLGESALAAIICQYIFPFFQTRATGNQDTLVQRTMVLPPQANPANPGRFAQVLIHVEKNGLWPALKTILCSGLITQVVNNAYCWAYGKKFSTDPSVAGTPSPIPGATAGGVIYIYASDGVTPAGLFEMDVVGQ